MLPQSKDFVLPLLRKEHVAKDTYSFYFSKSDEQLNFLPGQYIRISFSIGNGTISRFFTISSSPLENYLMITTKIHAESSPFKEALFDVGINEQVKFFGPIGGFVLRDEDLFEHVFLAGGIGITPFHSMITYIAQKKLLIPITLFVSFSTLEEVIYYNELRNIAKEHTNVKIIYTLTNADETWNGETGKISGALIEKHIPDIHTPTYYIAGSPGMVETVEEILEKMKIHIDKVKIDLFTGY